MEWRYLVAGSNIVILAAVMLTLGFATNSAQLIGVASSLLVPGVVLVALGLTYTDPLHRLYSVYSGTVGSVIERIAEDTGLLDKGALVACPREEDILVALAPQGSGCDELRPGLLVTSSGEPYIGFKVPVELVAEEGLSELDELLGYNIVSRYSLARGVSVRRSSRGVEVALLALQPELTRDIGRVAEPVKPLVAATVAYALGAPARLESWSALGDSYVLRFSVATQS